MSSSAAEPEVLQGPTLNLKQLARPNILSLKPYRCARDDYCKGVLLDANENPFGAPDDFITKLMTDLVRHAEKREKDFLSKNGARVDEEAEQATRGDAASSMAPFPLSYFSTVARYPDPMVRNLKRIISQRRAVRAEEIFVGVGSDEALDMVIRCFCAPGRDAIMVCPPHLLYVHRVCQCQ